MSTKEFADRDGEPLENLESKIPELHEQALRLRLTTYAQKRCAPYYREFERCTKDKLLGVIYKCKGEMDDLSDCMNAFASLRNLNILRHAYLDGKLMKKRTVQEYEEILEEKWKELNKEEEVQELLRKEQEEKDGF